VPSKRTSTPRLDGTRIAPASSQTITCRRSCSPAYSIAPCRVFARAKSVVVALVWNLPLAVVDLLQADRDASVVEGEEETISVVHAHDRMAIGWRVATGLEG